MFDVSFHEMAVRSDRNPSRWRRPLLRWLNGTESGWAIPVLLVGFVTAWTGYLMVAYSGTDLHPDVLETWILGRNFEWGNPKHPPLMGWIVRLWTDVFPLTNWSLQLMSMVNAAVGLWAVDLIARRFVTGDKRVLILLLLMVTPAYQFHAQRFNANSVLLSIWPLAIYCFLRSFQTRDALWAALAGATAALAMLGKYYSVFLIAAFVFAVLVHRSRVTYLRSYAPWISTVAGIAVLAPHLHWLAQSGAPTFDYARFHVLPDRSASLHEVVYFTLGLLGAMSISAVTWALIAGRRLSNIASDFAAADDGLKFLLLIGLGTILFPVLTCLIVGTDLPSLWALQGIFLFVVPVVASTSYSIERFYTVNTFVFACLMVLGATFVAAPIHALYRNNHGYEEGRNLYSQTVAELNRQWREVAKTPLAAVSGNDALAFAAAFYSPDHPRYARPFMYQYSWKIPRVTTLRQGWAALCFADQADCLEWMKTTAARARRPVQNTFEIQASLFGILGLRRSVVSLIVPPDTDAALSDDPISPGRVEPGLDAYTIRAGTAVFQKP